ncbi:lipid-A-disaccharide synthase [Ohtaekwangia koreensis]|uniref:Lipid-A-disaccharide synthase n=1 Tax=Ohtaekwangia koreensis TaxID=688867 RepID=A0A1T5LTL8_9BACT|nr:lipid-A-disaccharide synthase [Ohtaekwangia koreensis]SKC79290.1 lipid-A-disaccharide synthase [Ohtaekwangia koreensis]
MRYYIIAGERSGDLHGGNLVKALHQQDTNAIFRGFGGEHMQEAGVDLLVHYKDLAFMGFVEVLTNLTKISRYIGRCKEDILQFKPDVIVLIDYGGFNRRIARFGKKVGIKVFYYIPPKVWAWRQGRALDLKQNVDRLFVILPFEKPFFKKFDWDVDYVGNPVLDAVKAHVPDNEFLVRHNIDSQESFVALLPGSRKQELNTIVPLMVDVAKRFPDTQFAVAAVNNLDQVMYGGLKDLPNVKFVFEDTYNLLLYAKAAIVTSGTATLETALFKVPQIVVYKTSFITYTVVKWIIQVPYISLVNLIADKEVVKEMIQGDANPDKVSHELNELLNNASYRNNMLANYDEIINILDTGSASQNTARLMTGYLNDNKKA